MLVSNKFLRSFGKYEVNGIDSKNFLVSIYHFEIKCTDKIGDVHFHKLQNCGGTNGTGQLIKFRDLSVVVG